MISSPIFSRFYLSWWGRWNTRSSSFWGSFLTCPEGRYLSVSVIWRRVEGKVLKITGVAVRIGPCSAWKKDDTCLICFWYWKLLFLSLKHPAIILNMVSWTVHCKSDTNQWLQWIIPNLSVRCWEQMLVPYMNSLEKHKLCNFNWINICVLLFTRLPVSSVCSSWLCSCVFFAENNAYPLMLYCVSESMCLTLEVKFQLHSNFLFLDELRGGEM